MKDVTAIDITRLMVLVNTHNGERRDVPYGEPLKSYFELRKHGLVTLTADDEGCEGEPANWAHLLAGASITGTVTDKGRAFCDAILTAAKETLHA